MTAINLITKKAYSDIEKIANKMPDDIKQKISSELSQIAQKAAYMSEYLDMRNGHGCGDQGHKASAKSAYSVFLKVRKALGFYQHPNINI